MLSNSSIFVFMVKYQTERGEREQYFKFKTEAIIFAKNKFDAEIWKKIKYKKDE